MLLPVLGMFSRADFIRVYGVGPKNWRPVAACPHGRGGEPERETVIPARAGIQEPSGQWQMAQGGIFWGIVSILARLGSRALQDMEWLPRGHVVTPKSWSILGCFY